MLTVSGLSETAVLLVAMATGIGETLHRSPEMQRVFELSNARFA